MLPNNVRVEREKTGVSITKLGCSIGMAVGVLSDIELGKRVAYPKARRDLSNILGIAQEKLFPEHATV